MLNIPGTESFFQSWKQDPVLNLALQDGIIWQHIQFLEDPIPREYLRRLMTFSDDIILGNVQELLIDKEFLSRIDPPLEQDEYESFLTSYYKRCLLENPSSEYIANRYESAWELWRILKHHQQTFGASLMHRLVDMLADVFRNGDEALREAIMAGTLEHILMDERCQELFKWWADDPILREGYETGLKWAEGFADCPL
jgi:hypothetical protein